MRTISVNLHSLAPDSFVFGPEELIRQFSPQKVLEIVRVQEAIFGNLEGNASTAGPWAVEIHPTSHCQLRCVHCSYAERNQDGREISPEVLERILGEVEELGASSLIYSGGGDPLAWSRGRLGDHLRSSATFAQSLGTNGLGLTRHLEESSLSKLRIIQINVNGYNRKSFMRTTRRDLFQQYLKNVLWLLEHRDKRLTQVSAKILVDRFNYREIPSYLQFCIEVGFDVINVKLAGNFEPGQDLELAEEQKCSLRNLLLSSAACGVYPALLDAIATRDNTIEHTMPKRCWTIDLGLYALIRSNGDVYPCVVSPYSGANRMGNVYEDALGNIWEGDGHRRIRTKLHQDMRTAICNLKVCRHFRYNLVIQEMMDDKEAGAFPEDETSRGEKPALL